jgi:DHA3 family macrolide efflux protein-like MFS transporter
MSLMPILVTSYFGGGVVEFATMEMAIGASFLLGGIGLGVWGGFKSKIVTMLVSGVLAGIGVVVVGIVPPEAFYIAIGGMFFAGLMISMVNGSAQAVMQAAIPPDKQGRVFGLIGSVSVAMTPVGLAVAGPVSDMLGVQIWFIVAGLGLSLVMASGFFTPSVMHIEDRVQQTVAVEEK